MADVPAHLEKPYRDVADLKRAVRAVARHFDADRVYVVGSQALLAVRPDISEVLRHTDEIDIFPGNAAKWEQAHPGQEASEEISALMGIGSHFHDQHGYYLDGVDSRTATLPADWEGRAVVRTIEVDGRDVELVVPEPQDLAISKLARLVEKDKEWLKAFNRELGLDVNAIHERLQSTGLPPEVMRQAMVFVRSLRREMGDHA